MFDGDTYDPDLDQDRLKAQLWRVMRVMKDAEWRTLFEVHDITGDPPQSVSARLRDFRKEKFGSHTVNRRRRGEGRRGLFEYQLILNRPEKEPDEDATHDGGEGGAPAGVESAQRRDVGCGLSDAR